jgi:DNA-binding MarR family transcriptional regulator
MATDETTDSTAVRDDDTIRWGRERWEVKFGLDAATAMETVSSIVRVREILIEFMDGYLSEAGMNFGEYDILNVIDVVGGGSMPLGKIGLNARRFFTHQTSVTNVVSRLVDRGLVATRRDISDGRVTIAEVTPVGRRKLKKAHAILSEVQFGLDGLSEADMVKLNDLLFKVRVAHDDARPSGGRN